ncbi:MAG TPA: hemolysin family protein [Phycisphaerae bacterium]|nr:hemolysin family protein [Phycisphaerae bacterium]
MGFIIQNIVMLLVLLVLLAVSGLFSGSETVLFSLSRHDRARMKKSANRLEAMAAGLMDHPRALLTSILMGNMTCNIVIFVLSALLLGRLRGSLEAQHGGWWPGVLVGVLTVVPPVLVTYVSDVFPKVVGNLNNTRIAPVIALPVATLLRVLWPVHRALDVALIRPMHRLIMAREGPGVFSGEELRELLEMSERQGVIDVSENELLQEVVRIGELKVRDVMTPRVDMVAFDVRGDGAELIKRFRQSHLAKMPVYDGAIDNVLGLVYAKTVLLEAGGTDGRRLDVRRLIQPVRYVPEQQTLDRLLVHFRQTKTQLAVVVDEYGGVVGVVALEDVVEQMVGDIYEPHDAPEKGVQRVGENEYVVPGDLSIADWMEAFGARVEATRTSTVAGLLAVMLKRLPRVGDEVRFAHVRMKVETMHGRRVEQVRLKLLGKPGEAVDEGTASPEKTAGADAAPRDAGRGEGKAE